MSLLCLDKRDGRVVLKADDLNFSYGSLLLAGNPAERTVYLRLLNIHSYNLIFTQEPVSPQPPARLSRAGQQKGSRFLNAVGAVVDAFGRAVQRQGKVTEEEVRILIEQAKQRPADAPRP